MKFLAKMHFRNGAFTFWARENAYHVNREQGYGDERTSMEGEQ